MNKYKFSFVDIIIVISMFVLLILLLIININATFSNNINLTETILLGICKLIIINTIVNFISLCLKEYELEIK